MLRYRHGHGKILEYVMVDRLLQHGFHLEASQVQKHNRNIRDISKLSTDIRQDFSQCADIFHRYLTANQIDGGKIFINDDHYGKRGIVSDFDIERTCSRDNEDGDTETLTVSMKNNNLFCKNSSPRALIRHISSCPDETYHYQSEFDRVVEQSNPCQDPCLAICDFVQVFLNDVSSKQYIQNLFYFQTGIQASHIVKNSSKEVHLFERVQDSSIIESVNVRRTNNALTLRFNDEYDIVMRLYPNRSSFRFNTVFPGIESFYDKMVIVK